MHTQTTVHELAMTDKPKPPARRIYRTDANGVQHMGFVPTTRKRRRLNQLVLVPVPRAHVPPRPPQVLIVAPEPLHVPAPRIHRTTRRKMSQVLANLKYYRWRDRLVRAQTQLLNVNNQNHVEELEEEIRRAKGRVKSYAFFNTMEDSDISDDDDDGTNEEGMNTDDISEDEGERIPEPEPEPSPVRRVSFGSFPDLQPSYQRERPSQRSFPSNGPPLEEQYSSDETQTEVYPFELSETRPAGYDSTKSYVSDDDTENFTMEQDPEGTQVNTEEENDPTAKTLPYESDNDE